jgi:hypothetical protein
MPIIRSSNSDYRIWCPILASRATQSEQCTQLAAQRYATQAAFQGWTPNAVVTIYTPDDGHAGARNMLSQ